MKQYTVHYKRHLADCIRTIVVIAHNVAEAYDKAVYEELPQVPYSAWVAGVTYNNGNVKRFNNFEGKPY